jgi:hypothetical protein
MRRYRIRIAVTVAVAMGATGAWTKIYLDRADDRGSFVAGCDRAVAQRINDIAQDDDIAIRVDDPIALMRIRARQGRTRSLIVNCRDVYPAPSPWPWKG